MRIYHGGLGDLPGTAPIVVAHLVTAIGVWRGKDADAIADRFPSTKRIYSDWANDYANRDEELPLGRVLLIKLGIERDVYVANIIAQRLGRDPDPEHVAEGLNRLMLWAMGLKRPPRIYLGESVACDQLQPVVTSILDKSGLSWYVVVDAKEPVEIV